MKQQIKNINGPGERTVDQHENFFNYMGHWRHRRRQQHYGKNDQRRIWDFIQEF